MCLNKIRGVESAIRFHSSLHKNDYNYLNFKREIANHCDELNLSR